MRMVRIPEEIFIITITSEGGVRTPAGVRPFYDRQEAEHAAARMGNSPEVTGYHIIRSVILG